MTTLLVAFDVFREAFARRALLGLFAILLLGQVTLALALDLDVVEGAIVAGRMFGSQLSGGSVESKLRPVFEALATAVFHLGLLFGIVASSDVAAKLLAPGRVELLLALPVRRAELVVGTYLGVIGVAILSTTFAVTGVSVILYFKTGFATPAALAGAACATVGFMAVYAAMLLSTALVRAPALASGVGLVVYVLCLVTSNRETFTSWFQGETTQAVMGVLIAPLPRFGALVDVATGLAADGSLAPATALGAVAGTLAFAGAGVAAAAYVVSGRDY